MKHAFFSLMLTSIACGSSNRRAAPGPVQPSTNNPDAGVAINPPNATAPDENLNTPEYGECTKVDVLFVIDNSASMADQQQSLINSFEGFVNGMRAHLSMAESFHVGVVTSDAYRFNEAGCQDIGDLVTQTGGGDSSGGSCGPFAEGGRFMSDLDNDLNVRFACAAQVGTFGNDDERMARAMLNAISTERNAPGACNAGFVRPDSLLVVVMITDEDDVECADDPWAGPGDRCEQYGSGGQAPEWLDELRQYRPNPDSTVVLGLFGSSGNGCGAQINSRLRGFANRFGDNGYTGDVCAQSYDQFFRDALPVIETACLDLI